MTNSLHSDAQSLDTQSSASNLDEMRKVVASLPKVLLHDHLDGGLRPQTVIDLAAD
ncbi:MAG: adenosine deaminase, partial [Corynebacterium sp.]|nr:adenosine deaminase [Corynebacterium sp.]